MQRSFIDVDGLKENCVELPKAAKAEDVVIDIKYDVKDIKAYLNNNILDVTAKLLINILYKSVDHTIRWNEQIIPISISQIWEEDVFDMECQCINIKKITEKIDNPNIYTQQIYICFRIHFNKELVSVNAKKGGINKKHMEEILRSKEEISCAEESNLSLLVDRLIESLKT